MTPELFNQIKLIIEQDFNGDLDLFISALQTKLLESKSAQAKTYEENQKSKNKLIEITNLTKSYHVGRETIIALRDINLSINEGEIIALTGPSGSGKSTLLNLIGGLDRADNGEININGVSLRSMNDREISNYRNNTVGFVFQFFNLQPYLNIQENVEVPLIFRGETAKNRAEASQSAIKAVGLTERIKHLPNQLSGGQMQRVAIARSIVNKPKLILADEPTGNLDHATGTEIINLIKKINQEQNATIIIVTHDNFIANQADRIIRLSDGKIV